MIYYNQPRGHCTGAHHKREYYSTREEYVMQSTGIVRKLDSLGRITLPMELRKSFDIGEREPLEIFTEEDKIIIKKYNPSDIFTGQCEDLIEYRGKKVSRDSRIAGFKLTEE